MAKVTGSTLGLARVAPVRRLPRRRKPEFRANVWELLCLAVSRRTNNYILGEESADEEVGLPPLRMAQEEAQEGETAVVERRAGRRLPDGRHLARTC